MVCLKERLRNGEVLVGSWITLAHPAIAEIMARAGFDWLTIDLEHSVITIREAEELIRVIELCGVAPLVRVSANDPVQIKRVMDAGAHGVIVPMVNTPGEAADAVAAVQYPPAGRRGVGLARAQGYGTGFRPYLEWLRADAVVIVQVEHVDAVNCLEDILSLPGVDGYFIGPYDLSASMGLAGEFDHPEMVGVLERIKRAGEDFGKPGGLHVVEPDTSRLEECINQGFRFIAYSLDTRMLDNACRTGLSAVRESGAGREG
jgi:2-dehydro-3-deoxyglucarate aldolase